MHIIRELGTCCCFLNWAALGWLECSLAASLVCLVLWGSLNMKLRNPEPLESKSKRKEEKEKERERIEKVGHILLLDNKLKCHQI